MSTTASPLNSGRTGSPSIAESARWLPRRGVPAWLLSFLLHLCVFTVLGLAVKVTPGGLPTAGDTLRGGQIVLATNSSGRTEYFSDSEGGSASGDVSASVAAADAPSSSVAEVPEAPPTGGPQLPSGSGAAGPVSSGSLPGAGELLGSSPGGVRASGLGAKAQTDVFGVPGEGTSFIYVFDRSSSMAGFEGRPLASAKRELMASLEKLDRVHQFQVIFYNQAPRLMQLAGGQTGMVFADDEGKKSAVAFVGSVVADGGTRHFEALQTALGMRPDVIFFLTDADEPQLLPDELARIRRLNHGASINAIEFGSGPPSGAANFLKRLARENGGNYGYVDVTQLPRS